MKFTPTGDPGARRLPAGILSSTLAALILAISVGCLDVLIALPRSPESWTTVGELVPPLAAVAALALPGFLLVWHGLLARLARRLRLDQGALLAAAGVFVCTAFGAMSAEKLIRLDPPSWPPLVGTAITLLAAGALAQAAYTGLTHPRTSLVLRSAGGRLARLIPVFLLLAVLGVGVVNLPGGPRAVALAGSAVAAIGLAWGLWRASARAAAVTMAVLFTAVALAGAAALIQRNDFVRAGRAAPNAGGHRVRHVILISADSLRADALSCYSSTGAPTPHVDRLAAESALFRHAYSSASWTLPATASLLTGLPTFAHQVFWMETRLPDEIPTVADLMAAAGYATAAVTENPVLDPRLNLYKGFQEYAHLPKAWPWEGDAAGRQLLARAAPSRYYRGGTEAVTGAATRWLERNRDRDFFLWVHYFDPHVPYSPPERFLPPGPAPPSIGNSFDRHVEVLSGTRFLRAEERAWVRELYLGEVRYLDEQVGILVDSLRRLGLYDDALIVFTSDHGEEFWDHGAYQHGHSMYEEVIAVPLLVKFPGGRPRGSYSSRVSTQFVMPTVLDACGISARQSCYAAPSLARVAAGQVKPDERGPLVQAGSCYYEELEAVIFDGSYKLIRRRESGREELFDLRADPAETRSLVAASPGKAEAGRRTLEELAERLRLVRACYQASDKPAPAGGTERLRQLKSLGYLN
jgi:arylsulfatase A-like enzyme